MSKRKLGNAANTKLNGEWAKHVRGRGKKLTSRMRRCLDKKVIRDERNFLDGL